MTRQHFAASLRDFLLQHSRDRKTLNLLANKESCLVVWDPLLTDLDTRSEFSLAVRLAYALACNAHGINSVLLQEDGDEAETAMLMLLESLNVTQFADWDEE